MSDDYLNGNDHPESRWLRDINAANRAGLEAGRGQSEAERFMRDQRIPGVTNEEFSALYQQVQNGSMNADELSTLMSAMSISKDTGAALDSVLKDPDFFLSQYGIDAREVKPDSWFEATRNALWRGRINTKIGQLWGDIRTATNEGNPETARYYLGEIEKLEQEAARFADPWAGKRNLLVTGLGFAAESAPYMAYITAGSIAAGPAGGFATGWRLNRDNEYGALIKAGVGHETAEWTSNWVGAAQAAVELGLGRGAGTIIAKLGGVNVASLVTGKVVNAVTKRLRLSGIPYQLAKLGFSALWEAVGEGGEEVIQSVLGYAGLLSARGIQYRDLEKALADPDSPESRALLDRAQDVILEDQIDKMSGMAALEVKAELLGLGVKAGDLADLMKTLPGEFAGGFLSSLVLGAGDVVVDIPGGFARAREIAREARRNPSKEAFVKGMEGSGIPEQVLENTYENARRRRDREEARVAAEIKARGSQLAGLEERQVNEAGEDVTPGVYRNADRSLYTRIEDEKREGGAVTGSFRMGDGSRTTESNTYGAIDYRIENGVLTITGMNIADHRRDLTGEFFQDFAKKFADNDIQWDPETGTDIALKEQLAAANRRGPEAGLNYFEPEAVRGEALEIQQVKQNFDRQLAEALPRTTAESRQGVISLLDRIGKGYGLEFDEFLDRLGFDRDNVFTNTPNQDVVDFNDRAAQYAKDPDRRAARGAMFKILKNLDAGVKAVEYTVVYLDPESADFSTVIHELKHAVDDFLERADPDFYRRMMDAAGPYDPKSGMDEKTWRKERSAYAFENYLRTGEAPTPELRGLFRQMVEWLRDIVNRLSGMRKLTPEQKAVFDELLTKADSSENGPESPGTQNDTSNTTEGPLRAASTLSEDISEGAGTAKYEENKRLNEERSSLNKNTARGDPKPTQPSNDLDEIYRLVEESRAEFDAYAEALRDKYGGEIISRKELKARDRASRKITEDEGPEYILDINGKTLVLDDIGAIIAVMEDLRGRDEVVRMKDRYKNPAPGNYRDTLTNIRMSNGAIVELQLNTRQMLAAKEEYGGHILYEVQEQINKAIKTK